MRDDREFLDKYFVDRATVMGMGDSLSMEARKAAQHLVKLRKISQLCGKHEGELAFPAGRRDTKNITKVDARQCKNLPKILLRFSIQDFCRMEQHYPDFRFCIYVETIRKAMEKNRYFDVLNSWNNKWQLTEEDKKMFERLILNVKRSLKSENFRAWLANYERAANKNAKSGRVYIDKVFGRYSKVIVTRADFHYHKEYSNGAKQVSLEEALEHRNKLLRSMRYRKEFKHLVGMLWKVEYTYLALRRFMWIWSDPACSLPGCQSGRSW